MWDYPYTSFVTRPDDEGRRLHTNYLLAYVDDDGVLSWTDRSLNGVALRHVVRSRDEGFFDGDPWALRVQRPTGGDGVLPDSWDDLVRWLLTFGAAWQGIKSVGEAARSLGGLIERSKRALEARRGKPWAVFPVVLGRESWDYGELARYLDLPLDVVIDVLESLGYEQDAADGRLFRQKTDADAAALRDEISAHLVGMPLSDSKRYLWEVQGKPPDWRPP